jgi:outer membrane receptor protein involved in Fe transport
LQFANVRLDATRLRDWDDTVAQQRLFKVPEHTGSLFITQEINSSWSFSLMGYHQSYVDWRGGEEMEGFDRYDITLSKKIDFGYQQLRFDFRVENVADKNYLEYQKGNYFERAFYFKAGINW